MKTLKKRLQKEVTNLCLILSTYGVLVPSKNTANIESTATVIKRGISSAFMHP